jgi:hypothetical protein
MTTWPLDDVLTIGMSFTSPANIQFFSAVISRVASPGGQNDRYPL